MLLSSFSARFQQLLGSPSFALHRIRPSFLGEFAGVPIDTSHVSYNALLRATRKYLALTLALPSRCVYQVVELCRQLGKAKYLVLGYFKVEFFLYKLNRIFLA